MSDFPAPDALLAHHAHRPWPLPDGRWIMTQSWHDLLFAHWRIDPHYLRARVPAPLGLDRFEGHAWVGVIPFYMTNVTARFIPPVPGLSNIAELNVRTYVTYEGKPGIYFFSLDADSRLAVAGARSMFHLPYHLADMSLRRGDDVTYRSRRIVAPVPADFSAWYRPIGPPSPPAPGSLEYFLTERYCLYVVERGTVHKLEIHHPAWPLQPAEAQIDVNTMARAAGIDLPDDPPLLHFARRQDMLAWPMTAV